MNTMHNSGKIEPETIEKDIYQWDKGVHYSFSFKKKKKKMVNKFIYKM